MAGNLFYWLNSYFGIKVGQLNALSSSWKTAFCLELAGFKNGVESNCFAGKQGHVFIYFKIKEGTVSCRP